MSKQLFLPTLILAFIATCQFSFAQELEVEEYEMEELEAPIMVNSNKDKANKPHSLPNRKSTPPVEKFEEAGKFGLKRAGQIITPARYDYIDYNGWWTGRTVAVKRDGKRGRVDSTGKELIPCIYDDVHALGGLSTLFGGDESLYKVWLNGKCGIVNVEHEFVVPMKYTGMYETDAGFEITKDGLTGLMSKDLKVLVPPKYEEFWQVHRDIPVFNFWTDGEGGIVHQDGRVVDGLKKQAILPVANSQGSVERTFKPVGLPEMNRYWYALEDVAGKVGVFHLEKFVWVIEPKYRAVTQVFSEAVQPYFIVKDNQGYGLVNEKDEVILPTGFDTLYFDQLTLFPIAPADMMWNLPVTARKKGKYGLVNTNGEWITKPIWDEVQCIYSNGDELLYRVKKKGLFQLMNRKGNLVTKAKWEFLSQFSDTLAFAIQKGEKGVVQPDGTFRPEQFPRRPKSGFTDLNELGMALVQSLGNEEKLEDFLDKATINAYALHFFKSSLKEGDKIKSMAYPVAYMDDSDVYTLRSRIERGLRRISRFPIPEEFLVGTIVAPNSTVAVKGEEGLMRVGEFEMRLPGVAEYLPELILCKLIVRIDGYWYLMHPPEGRH